MIGRAWSPFHAIQNLMDRTNTCIASQLAAGFGLVAPSLQTAGFRSPLSECADLGFAHEQGVDHSDGIFDKRFTVDLIWKF